MVSQNSQVNEATSHLPNQQEFAELASHLLEFSERAQSKAALLYIHFDDGIQDLKLKGLAIEAVEHTLLLLARDADIFAHLDGMNFVNLSIETSAEHIPKLIEKLKMELSQAIDLADGSSITLPVKITGAQFPTDGSNCQELLEAARASS